MVWSFSFQDGFSCAYFDLHISLLVCLLLCLCFVITCRLQRRSVTDRKRCTSHDVNWNDSFSAQRPLLAECGLVRYPGYYGRWFGVCLLHGTGVPNERNLKIDLSLLETINWPLIRGLQLIFNYRGKIISALHSQLALDTRPKLPARVREDAFSQPATLMKSWFSQQVLTALFCQPGIVKITLFRISINQF